MSRRRIRAAIALAVVAAVAIGAFGLLRPQGLPPGPSPVAVATGSPSPRITLSAPLPSPSSTPSGPSTAPPTGAPIPEVAIVPIVGYWSTLRSMTSAELGRALAGQDRRFSRVLVAGPDGAAVAAALGIPLPTGPTAGSMTASALIAAVQGHTDVLGFVRAEDVRPSVRALGIDGRTLFGNDRLRTIAGWALTIPAPGPGQVPASSSGFDPASTWTLVAAGDVMNDRSVYREAVLDGRGPDFPWAGGTARVVRRICCTGGLTTVQAVRTGAAGAVADLFRNADLALVNHEGPTPNAFSYHPTGLTFSFDPALEAGLRNAGVDVVSLANNHIRNAGSIGVLQTLHNVRAAGLTPVGAGSTSATANAPAWFTEDGVRVAILAFDAINLAANGATATRPGAAPLDLVRARSDIRAARAAGAQVVIVIPHWGVEYTSTATTLQRADAAGLIAAGADVLLGSHPHWAGAMEAIGKGLVVYSMGDFIFDLPRSEQTDEGLVVELTFVGTHLAQIDIHPTIELDRSQPNLLDPAGGQVILDRIRQASRSFLHW